MKLFVAIFLLILTSSLSSCKKHSSRWLTGEFQIVDKVTKEPVRAYLELNYYVGYLLGSEETTVSLGTTDENGCFELERKINRKDSHFILQVHAYGYYGFYDSFLPDASREISKGGHNEVTIEVPPLYLLKISLNNVSCHDETDTVWINRTTTPEHSQVYTGCLNDSIPGDVFYWGNTENVSFRSISKKNGIYDTIIHTYTMIQGDENEFELNY